MDRKTKQLISESIYLHNLILTRGRITPSTVPSLIENIPPHLNNTISLTDTIDMQKYLLSFQSNKDENEERM
jgi:hypothetical protein